MENTVAAKYYGAKFTSKKQVANAISALYAEQTRLEGKISEYETKCEGYESVWPKIAAHIGSDFDGWVTNKMKNAVKGLENNYTGSKSASDMKTNIEGNLKGIATIKNSIDTLREDVGSRKTVVEQKKENYKFQRLEVIDAINYVYSVSVMNDFG